MSRPSAIALTIIAACSAKSEPPAPATLELPGFAIVMPPRDEAIDPPDKLDYKDGAVSRRSVSERSMCSGTAAARGTTPI